MLSPIEVSNKIIDFDFDPQVFADPEVFSNGNMVFEGQKVISNGSMDFDNPKVYDGLVGLMFKHGKC